MWKRSWDPGRWPTRSDRPRVLVEDPDGAVLDVCTRFLAREGFDVQVCAGPQGMGRRECPLVRGEGCALAAGADVVYTALAGSDPAGVEVVRALRQRYPGTPVVAEVTQPRRHALADVLSGCTVVSVPADQARMTATLHEALAASDVDGF